MRKLLGSMMLGSLLLCGVTSVAVAEDLDPEITAAQKDLESAKSHLQAAPHDYKGHRTSAVKQVNQALGEVKQALAVSEKREDKAEKKEHKAEKKEAAQAGKAKKTK